MVAARPCNVFAVLRRVRNSLTIIIIIIIIITRWIYCKGPAFSGTNNLRFTSRHIVRHFGGRVSNRRLSGVGYFSRGLQFRRKFVRSRLTLCSSRNSRFMGKQKWWCVNAGWIPVGRFRRIPIINRYSCVERYRMTDSGKALASANSAGRWDESFIMNELVMRLLSHTVQPPGYLRMSATDVET